MHSKYIGDVEVIIRLHVMNIISIPCCCQSITEYAHGHETRRAYYD